jgi:hypothetical protein
MVYDDIFMSIFAISVVLGFLTGTTVLHAVICAERQDDSCCVYTIGEPRSPYGRIQSPDVSFKLYSLLARGICPGGVLVGGLRSLNDLVSTTTICSH